MVEHPNSSVDGKREVPPAGAVDGNGPDLLGNVVSPTASGQGAPPTLETSYDTQARPATNDAPGDTITNWPKIAGYEILGQLGRGGMGIVYRARDLTLDRVVALKMLRPGIVEDAPNRERFRREARAMAQLDHPHIVPIYEEGEHQGLPYFTMKFIGGGTLGKHLTTRGVDARQAVAIVAKVARAVHYLHEKKILHRDLKPQNILLDDRDEPHVSDFGLVKLLDAGLDATLSGAVLGTVSYMAPEQATGRISAISPQSDVWALGVILYELLGGEKPFVGSGRDEVMHRILTKEPPALRGLRPGLDPALDAVVRKCLRKIPAQRYATAQALAEDLERWQRGEPAGERPGGWPARAWSSIRRNPWKSLAGVLGVAGAVLLTIVLLRESNRPDPSVAGLDPPIVLVGAGGPPERWRWVIGEQHALLGRPDPTKPFSFRTRKVSLLELRQAIPWARYRLEAEILHEESEAGEVGIFFGYGQSGRAPASYHVLCRLVFADQGREAGQVDLQAGRSPMSSPSALGRIRCMKPHRFIPTGRSKKPNRFRKLAVEVTPGQVRAFWEGELVGKISGADMRKYFATVPGKFNPTGGCGLYLDEGAALFRNVRLKPLP
jgi:tRNA A-37 threonylcarbamoyl transferase component Bud32